MMGILQRLLREPLLHFFAAGGLIFLLYGLTQDPRRTAPDVIIVSAEQLDRLAIQFESVWSRQPNEAELTHVVDGYIREEIYYREALALGLDKNDAVVRQRMRQKIEFLTDISAQMIDATDAELAAYLSEHADKYRLGTQRSFEQYFLGQAATQAEVETALQSLRANPAAQVGTRSMLPAELGLITTGAIDSIFGNEFSVQIVNFPVGEWSGPVTSSYGVHVVRVLASEESEPVVLAEIRATVLRDWQVAKADELRELDFLARKAHFTIEIFGRETESVESP